MGFTSILTNAPPDLKSRCHHVATTLLPNYSSNVTAIASTTIATAETVRIGWLLHFLLCLLACFNLKCCLHSLELFLAPQPTDTMRGYHYPYLAPERTNNMDKMVSSCGFQPPLSITFHTFNFSINSCSQMILDHDSTARGHTTTGCHPPLAAKGTKTKDSVGVSFHYFLFYSYHLHCIYQHFPFQWNVTHQPSPHTQYEAATQTATSLTTNKMQNGVLVSFCCLNFPLLCHFSHHFNFPKNIAGVWFGPSLPSP